MSAEKRTVAPPKGLAEKTIVTFVSSNTLGAVLLSVLLSLAASPSTDPHSSSASGTVRSTTPELKSSAFSSIETCVTFPIARLDAICPSFAA